MRQRVLIVDDEARNQRILVETLEDLVDLRTASSGDEALTIIPDFLPDLILLDLMMPGIDGYEVCRRVRAEPKYALMKILLVSGKAMLEERLKGYEVGADDYMTKPFISEELLAKAKVFLRLSGAEKELAEINRNLDLQIQERTSKLIATEALLINSAKFSALGEMAGGVAHEINNPLGIISGKAHTLRRRVGQSPLDMEKILEDIDKIENTTKRIAKIVTGLKTFSRNADHDSAEVVNVKKLVDETLDLCQERFKQHDVALEVDVPEELDLECRGAQISQIMINLLNNAFDAIQEESVKVIKLNAKKVGDSIVICVENLGPRISDEVALKLMQPFFTTKDVSKGTGLGLSISKGIAESHQGRLYLNREVTTATCFVIEIPCRQMIAKAA